MEIRIEPEPPQDERRAVEAAVERALADGPEPRTEWWREGVRENVEEPEAP